MGLSSKGTATTKNQKLLLYIIGIACVFTLCYLFIISPSITKTQGITAEISQLKNQLKEAESLDFDIKAREKQYNDLLAKYNEATTSLPKTDRYPQVAKEVETMASECGLTTLGSEFSPAKVVETAENNKKNEDSKENNKALKGMRTIKVTYVVNNDMGKALIFIDKIENYNRIAEINEINQSPSGISITFSLYDSGEGGEREEYDFN